jgi:DNA-binding transcriptional LysR family regulator
MTSPLTPDTLVMLDAIARHGSFSKAAAELGKVPSALTYSVRKLEEALDVLLFDRRGHKAVATPAGEELLREGRGLLRAYDELTCRVKRVATGWEVELSIAVDTVIPIQPLLEVAEDFYAQAPGTRLRFSGEVLQGTWDALMSGRADLVIGAAADGPTLTGPAEFGYQSQTLGEMEFVFCVAPHHPLASLPEPLAAATVQQYRAVAVADTSRRLQPRTTGLLSGQEAVTVASMHAKLLAQLRGLGCGNLPLPLARPYIQTGRLIAKRLDAPLRIGRLVYAWRRGDPGKALQWFLARLESDALRRALLELHPPTVIA